LAKTQAEGGTAAEMINRVLGHISDLRLLFEKTIVFSTLCVNC
jgi:hypothetical protein